MEYHDGQSLRKLIDTEGPVPPTEALRYARELLLAIEHAVVNGVIHGRISPSVVWITRQGQVKLCDYSVAPERGRLSDSFDLHEPREVDFSRPPEFFRDPESGAIETDARADIYGVGVALLYALTGRYPYRDKSAWEVASLLSRGIEPEPELQGITGGIRELLGLLLAADPSRRPADVEAARDGLDALTAGPPASRRRGTEAVFSGSIQNNELVEFVQMIEIHGKTGVLSIESESVTGDLTFAEGRIVAARMSTHDDTTAARMLIGVRRGRFRFHPKIPAHLGARRLELKVSALLLDLARELDESGFF
jgi:serine/threonine protein kinase